MLPLELLVRKLPPPDLMLKLDRRPAFLFERPLDVLYRPKLCKVVGAISMIEVVSSMMCSVFELQAVEVVG